ncbi:hypothetical protein [Haloprofundus halobius]|uniref:hypothetical protein n=1 Tax=Haloprofundus halobius TaxID=2876194 RepID=UPI001CCB228D|nr:hypothetical protein [Haloprofundus halobius]
MATFGTYLKITLTFVLAALLHDVMETVVDPMMSIGCGDAAPTVVDGATNCGYGTDAMTWFIGVVMIGLFIEALSRGVTASRRGV